MDFQVDSTNSLPYLTFTKNTDIRSDIYFSLAVRRGSFFANMDFGSELYKLKKVTDNSILLASQYAKQALSWLIQTGRASDIQAVALKRDTKSISLNIEVTQSDGAKLLYKNWLDVEDGLINWEYTGS